MGGVAEYKSLAKAVEVDTEWFKNVASLLPAATTSSYPNGRIVSFDAGPYNYSNGNNSQANTNIADSTYPCSQCGVVSASRSRHILNHCDRFRDRYQWRLENILTYVDSLLDHNSFKVFANIPDRRTTAGNFISLLMHHGSSHAFLLRLSQKGGTIPGEIQPIHQRDYFKTLVPEIVAIDRMSEEVFIFVISLPHESEMESSHTEKLNQYHEAVLGMRRAFNSCVNFYALEIGSVSGHVTESSRVALYELHKLTLTRQPPLEAFIRNVGQLARLSSYKIFKHRQETRSWKGLRLLYPDGGGRVFTSTKRNLMFKYVYPLARAGGCVVAIVTALFLLYLLCLLLQWTWSMMNSTILVFVFLGIVASILNIFRP